MCSAFFFFFFDTNRKNLLQRKYDTCSAWGDGEVRLCAFMILSAPRSRRSVVPAAGAPSKAPCFSVSSLLAAVWRVVRGNKPSLHCRAMHDGVAAYRPTGVLFSPLQGSNNSSTKTSLTAQVGGDIHMPLIAFKP